MTPAFGKAFHVARDVIARNHVEHDFDTVAPGNPLHFLDEILRLVIDRVIGPDLARLGALVVVAAGHDHVEPESLGEHDRHRADPAGPAVDQQRLAFGGHPAFEDVVPDREQSLGNRRGLVQRHSCRHGQAMPEMGEAVFGIAAAGDERADLLAEQRFGRALAQRDDFARYLEARDRRGARRRRVEALPLDDVGAVDPGMADPDQHLVFSRLRNRQRFGAEYLRPAGFVEPHCSHRIRQNLTHCKTPCRGVAAG